MQAILYNAGYQKTYPSLQVDLASMTYKVHRTTHFTNCVQDVHNIYIFIYIYILLHEWEDSTENIWFKAGSIGLTVGRANTKAENRIFSRTARPKECNNIII